jgi:hypothetical protein
VPRMLAAAFGLSPEPTRAHAPLQRVHATRLSGRSRRRRAVAGVLRQAVAGVPWPATPGWMTARFPSVPAALLRAKSPYAPLPAAPGALNELLKAAASLARHDPGVVAHLRAPLEALSLTV